MQAKLIGLRVQMDLGCRRLLPTVPRRRNPLPRGSVSVAGAGQSWPLMGVLWRTLRWFKRRCNGGQAVDVMSRQNVNKLDEERSMLSSYQRTRSLAPHSQFTFPTFQCVIFDQGHDDLGYCLTLHKSLNISTTTILELHCSSGQPGRDLCAPLTYHIVSF